MLDLHFRDTLSLKLGIVSIILVNEGVFSAQQTRNNQRQFKSWTAEIILVTSNIISQKAYSVQDSKTPT
jgi:hypothetical protein